MTITLLMYDRRDPDPWNKSGYSDHTPYDTLDQYGEPRAFVPPPVSSGLQTAASPDMELISMLFDFIETSPPGISGRIILMQHWHEVGWTEAAEETAREILRLDPFNGEARQFVQSLTMDQSARLQPADEPPRARQATDRPRHAIRPLPPPRTAVERAAMEYELKDAYERLQVRAKAALRETRQIRELQQEAGMTAPPPDNHLQDLKAMIDGRISAVVSVRAPLSARAIARVMEADWERALDVVVADLADFVRWRRSSGEPSGSNNDLVREMLARRVRALIAALPDTAEEIQHYPITALMHVEHEELERAYVNDERKSVV